MSRSQFLEILDLAWDDHRAIDGEAVGLIQIVIGKDEDDNMTLMLGANVPPEIAAEALEELVRRNQAGKMEHIHLRRRKAV